MGSRKNKRRILIYLIPVKMLRVCVALTLLPCHLVHHTVEDHVLLLICVVLSCIITFL